MELMVTINQGMKNLSNALSLIFLRIIEAVKKIKINKLMFGFLTFNEQFLHEHPTTLSACKMQAFSTIVVMALLTLIMKIVLIHEKLLFID